MSTYKLNCQKDARHAALEEDACAGLVVISDSEMPSHSQFYNHLNYTTLETVGEANRCLEVNTLGALVHVISLGDVPTLEVAFARVPVTTLDAFAFELENAPELGIALAGVVALEVALALRLQSPVGNKLISILQRSLQKEC